MSSSLPAHRRRCPLSVASWPPGDSEDSRVNLRSTAVESGVSRRGPDAKSKCPRRPSLYRPSRPCRAAVAAVLLLSALNFGSCRSAVAQAEPAARMAQTPVPAWQPVGPLRVNTTAWNLVTGSVISIAADPSDLSGNTVYLGTAGGGVWKSVNAAADPSSVQFLPLTDTYTVPIGSFASLSIGAVSVQPGGTGVILHRRSQRHSHLLVWSGHPPLAG